LKTWADWEVRFNKETDLNKAFEEHFVKATARLQEERAKDLAEFGASG